MWYKVLKPDGTSTHHHFQWSLPSDHHPGDWHTLTSGIVKPQERGFHVTQTPNNWLRLDCRVFEAEISTTNGADLRGGPNAMAARSARLTREVTAEWDFPNWWHIAHDLLLRDYFWNTDHAPILWKAMEDCTEFYPDTVREARSVFQVLGNGGAKMVMSDLQDPLYERLRPLARTHFPELVDFRISQVAESCAHALAGYIGAAILKEANYATIFFKDIDRADIVGAALLKGALINTQHLSP